MRTNSLNYSIIGTIIVIMLFTVSSPIFCGISFAGGQLQAGNKYKIVGPVYLSGIYMKLNNRQLSKQATVGSLTAVQFSGPEVGLQRKVPIGTIMTIIGPAPKRFPLFFLADQYYIKLDPDLLRGIDIEIELNRGIDGNLDGLNPELFSREVKP